MNTQSDKNKKAQVVGADVATRFITNDKMPDPIDPARYGLEKHTIGCNQSQLAVG